MTAFMTKEIFGGSYPVDFISFVRSGSLMLAYVLCITRGLDLWTLFPRLLGLLVSGWVLPKGGTSEELKDVQKREWCFSLSSPSGYTSSSCVSPLLL